jgi:hypothetical protein
MPCLNCRSSSEKALKHCRIENAGRNPTLVNGAGGEDGEKEAANIIKFHWKTPVFNAETVF